MILPQFWQNIFDEPVVCLGATDLVEKSSYLTRQVSREMLHTRLYIINSIHYEYIHIQQKYNKNIPKENIYIYINNSYYLINTYFSYAFLYIEYSILYHKQIILYHIYSILTSKYQVQTFLKNHCFIKKGKMGKKQKRLFYPNCYFFRIEIFLKNP